MERRSASGFPSTSIPGYADQAATARLMKDSSRSRMAPTPTASLSWNTSPARIEPTMSGVPPSSRSSMSPR